MMVFDRRTCRWRPWHGSRVAWLKLPHAVATGVCVLSTAALLALHATPRIVPVSHPAVTPPPSDDRPPITAFEPFLNTATRGLHDVVILPTPILAPTSDVGTPPLPFPGLDPSGSNPLPLDVSIQPSIPAITNPPVGPTTQVPEPGSLMLLAEAVLLLAAARRGSQSHLRRRDRQKALSRESPKK